MRSLFTEGQKPSRWPGGLCSTNPEHLPAPGARCCQTAKQTTPVTTKDTFSFSAVSFCFFQCFKLQLTINRKLSFLSLFEQPAQRHHAVANAPSIHRIHSIMLANVADLLLSPLPQNCSPLASKLSQLTSTRHQSSSISQTTGKKEQWLDPKSDRIPCK